MLVDVIVSKESLGRSEYELVGQQASNIEMLLLEFIYESCCKCSFFNSSMYAIWQALPTEASINRRYS